MFSSILSLYISLIAFSSQNALWAKPLHIPQWPFSMPASVMVTAQKPAATETKKIVPEKLVDLGITLHHQIYTLSCEAASLQMALEYKGISKTQDQILEQIGVSQPYKSYYKDGTMIWGDPNLGFVGNVSGLFSTPDAGMYGATGWGVNKDPIARVAQSYRPASEAFTGFTTKDVIRELDAGNPLVFWHVPDSYAAGSINYQTPEGKTIRFFRNHVAVISGYKIVDGSTFFLISDPLYGEYTLTESTLARRMAKYDGDVVVVR